MLVLRLTWMDRTLTHHAAATSLCALRRETLVLVLVLAQVRLCWCAGDALFCCSAVFLLVMRGLGCLLDRITDAATFAVRSEEALVFLACSCR